MTITNVKTDEECASVIEPLTASDYKNIKATEYKFNWHLYKGKAVYKLRLINETAILGLIHIIPYPQEGYQFLQIDLLEVGQSNRGKHKTYDKIAGCLIAFACKQSFVTGCTGVVMLIAKTQIANLYHAAYGFEYIGGKNAAGVKMVSDYENSNRLIKKYLE